MRKKLLVSTFMLEKFIDYKVVTAVIILAVVNVFIGSIYTNDFINFLNLIIIFYFTLESLIKISLTGFRCYLQKNKLDFIILIASLLFLLLPSEAIGNVQYLRIFRMLTIIKVLKITPNSNHIITGLIRAMKASKAILLLLFVMLIFFSLLGFTLFSTYLPEYFGNPFLAMNSVFTIFTIENWGVIPEAASSLSNEYLYYAVNSYVILVLILGGFIAVSLANAIFIDEMVSDNNAEISEEIKKLRAENKEIKEIILSIKNGKRSGHP